MNSTRSHNDADISASLTHERKSNPHEVNRMGRYAVAIELFRYGVHAHVEESAATFWSVTSGTCRIHVCAKTEKSPSGWQTRIDYGHEPLSKGTANPRDWWIFVDLRDAGQPLEFYVVPAEWIEEDIYKIHQQSLESHGGARPRSPGSLHHLVTIGRVAQWRDKWSTLIESPTEAT